MYEESCKLFSHCTSKGILVTMENPTNSLFWKTDPFMRLVSQDDIYFASVQMCMLGGFRPKWTSIAANFPEISEFDIACDGHHTHLPWGKVRTAEGKEILLQAWKQNIHGSFALPSFNASVESCSSPIWNLCQTLCLTSKTRSSLRCKQRESPLSSSLAKPSCHP